METSSAAGQSRFRVWIAGYDRWQPCDPHDIPAGAVALEPAEEGTMSQAEAAAYVEAFNRVALCRRGKIWAVALPVAIRYEGDLRPGQAIEA